MSKTLDDLHPGLAPLYEKLLQQARDKGWTPIIVDVLRTPAQQALNIQHGVSWTAHSLHLPQPCCGKSHAVDIGLEHLLHMKNWAPQDPDWTTFGHMGEALGFTWGGKWTQRDLDHFQIDHPQAFLRKDLLA